MVATIPELSVVVLCYRSEAFAAVFAAQMKEVLEKNNLDYEIVLVGNYRSDLKLIDSTPQIVAELAAHDDRITSVIKEKQGMMGWDMRTGLEVARGATIAIIDGDGQMFPEDVIRVYYTLLAEKSDIVKTYREARYDGFSRVLISVVYNIAVKILFPKVYVRDVNSKPKIFTRDALKRLALASNDWFIDAEMILKGTYLGMYIVEIPTTFRPNEHRPSFVGLAAIREFILNLLRYRVRLWRYKKL